MRSAAYLIFSIGLAYGWRADACSAETRVDIAWPETIAAPGAGVVVRSRSIDTQNTHVRLTILRATSTTSAELAPAKFESKYLSVAHPHSGIEELWFSERALEEIGEITMVADLVAEGDRVVATSSRTVRVVAGEPDAPPSISYKGVFFLRGQEANQPFDSCSGVPANEGTMVFMDIRGTTPALVHVRPEFPCESEHSDPPYALFAGQQGGFVFSLFSRNCGIPSLSSEVVDVYGRRIHERLAGVESCAATLRASRWTLDEWHNNGTTCAGVLDAGVATDAGATTRDGSGGDGGYRADGGDLLGKDGCSCLQAGSLGDGGLARVCVILLLAYRVARSRTRAYLATP